VLFYPIWFLTKRAKDTDGTGNQMSKQGIALVIISSISCLGVAIFLVVTSTPDNYSGYSQQELWFYIFQLTPILIALFTWTILHPSRSLLLNDQKQ
jgi:ABC-type arginine/histidine transport system permease subunit